MWLLRISAPLGNQRGRLFEGGGALISFNQHERGRYFNSDKYGMQICQQQVINPNKQRDLGL